MVVLYTSLKDLVNENNRLYESMRLTDAPSTPEYVVEFFWGFISSQFLMPLPRQDNLQSGYLELARTLPWLHTKLGQLNHEECKDMLKKVWIIILQHILLSADRLLAEERSRCGSG
jgi:hypothetical protein